CTFFDTAEVYSPGLSGIGHNELIVGKALADVRTGQEINARIAAYGAKMFVQVAFGLGRNAGLSAPSELTILWDPSRKTRALTAHEIEAKMAHFAEACKVVQQAGFAGVDVHAIHWGHLLVEFAMPLMNHRTDEYGGSLENRLRIPREVAELNAWYQRELRVANVDVRLGEEATPTKVAECQFGTYAARAVRATQWPSSPALAGGATPRRLCGRFAMLPIVPAPLV
ncbi:MAG: hypothetical protein Q4A07_04835, partial [Coriobacteriales bacterium]|nr:hypothetical protein [Coriobacteriales bacterium]